MKVIPHNKQRYDTCGDYFFAKGVLEVRVSAMKNQTHELAIFVHELLESHLCSLAGVSFAEIDEFDKCYEEARGAGERHASCGCLIQEEPGMDVHAPYHVQHVFATKLEREFVGEAAWTVYDKRINEL